MSEGTIYTSKEIVLADIHKLIKDRTKHGKKNVSFYKTRHNPLHDFCPAMFEKICEQGSDTPMGIVEQMLNYKFSVERGEISYHDASVAVGQVCVDKYVKPLLPPEEAQ